MVLTYIQMVAMRCVGVEKLLSRLAADTASVDGAAVAEAAHATEPGATVLATGAITSQLSMLLSELPEQLPLPSDKHRGLRCRSSSRLTLL